MSSLKNERFQVVALLLLGFGFASTTGFDYSAPDEWPIEYPNCGGQRQSPIDIQSQTAAFNSDLGLNFNNYNRRDTGDFTVTNNGHSVVVAVAKDSGISISHGLLPNTYTLEQFHFHWGSDDTKGSEHGTDGQFYPLEIHFVHYNSDFYTSVSAAANNSLGLAVIGILVAVNPNAIPIPEVDELVSRFSEVPYEGESTTMPSFMIDSLFPARPDYFRYEGSLTTPPCYESVTWTVLDTCIEFTPEQLKAFRGLHSNVRGEPDVPLVDNTRPVQAMNGRSLLKSFR